MCALLLGEKNFSARNLAIVDRLVMDGCHAANHDYGAGAIHIEAYRARCDVASLRCLEHEAMGWFHTHEFEASPLAPAALFLREMLEARHGGNAPQAA